MAINGCAAGLQPPQEIARRTEARQRLKPPRRDQARQVPEGVLRAATASAKRPVTPSTPLADPLSGAGHDRAIKAPVARRSTRTRPSGSWTSPPQMAPTALTVVPPWMTRGQRAGPSWQVAPCRLSASSTGGPCALAPAAGAPANRGPPPCDPSVSMATHGWVRPPLMPSRHGIPLSPVCELTAWAPAVWWRSATAWRAWWPTCQRG
jgi:hypothetical protein